MPELKTLTIFRDAWHLSRAQRLTFSYVAVVYILVTFFLPDLFKANVTLMSLPFVLPNLPQLPSWWLKSLPYLAVICVQLPIMAAVWVMSIKRASGAIVHVKQLLAYFKFNYLVKFLTFCCWCIIIFLPLLILVAMVMTYPQLKPYLYLRVSIYVVLAGLFIYLAVAYMFAIPLFSLQELTSGQALTQSRKLISQHWFKFCWIFIVAYIPVGLLRFLYKLSFAGIYFYHPPQIYLQYLPMLGMACVVIVGYFLLPWFFLVLGKTYCVMTETSFRE